MTILEVCNPHRAETVPSARVAIKLALPCRISVFEEGGQVKNRYDQTQLPAFAISDSAGTKSRSERSGERSCRYYKRSEVKRTSRNTRQGSARPAGIEGNGLCRALTGNQLGPGRSCGPTNTCGGLRLSLPRGHEFISTINLPNRPQCHAFLPHAYDISKPLAP